MLNPRVALTNDELGLLADAINIVVAFGAEAQMAAMTAAVDAAEQIVLARLGARASEVEECEETSE